MTDIRRGDGTIVGKTRLTVVFPVPGPDGNVVKVSAQYDYAPNELGPYLRRLADEVEKGPRFFTIWCGPDGLAHAGRNIEGGAVKAAGALT